jgi:hypothetical protein
VRLFWASGRDCPKLRQGRFRVAHTNGGMTKDIANNFNRLRSYPALARFLESLPAGVRNIAREGMFHEIHRRHHQAVQARRGA